MTAKTPDELAAIFRVNLAATLLLAEIPKDRVKALLEEFDAALEKPESMRALYTQYEKLRWALRDLIAELPRCDGDRCGQPATRANGRGGDRWCDDHGTNVAEYPRAEPLRRALALLKGQR